MERFGRLDAAIANAGGASADHFRADGAGVVDRGDPKSWAPMVLANVLGPALLAKATLPHLERSRGRLVLIGSVAGTKNSPGMIDTAFWHGQAPPIAMSPDSVAEAIGFALDRAVGVDLNTVTIRPIGQPV